MSIIESINNFIKTCPYLEQMRSFGVDYLGDNNDAVSIEEVAANSIIEEYIDGSSDRQFVFVIAARLYWSDEVMNNINNSGLFENVQEWLEQCTNNEQFPTLDEGLTPYKIEAMSTSYVLGVNSDISAARYQIQCRLLYTKE